MKALDRIKYNKKIDRWQDKKTGKFVPFPIIFNEKENKFQYQIGKKQYVEYPKERNKYISKTTFKKYKIREKYYTLSDEPEYLLKTSKDTKKYLDNYNKKIKKAKKRKPTKEQEAKLSKIVRSKLRYSVRIVRFIVNNDGSISNQSPEILSKNNVVVLSGFHSLSKLNKEMPYPNLTDMINFFKPFIKMSAQEGFTRWRIDYDWSRYIQYDKLGNVYNYKNWMPLTESL